MNISLLSWYNLKLMKEGNRLGVIGAVSLASALIAGGCNPNEPVSPIPSADATLKSC